MEIHITKNGQRLGPYNEEQLTELLQAGQITYDDLAWVDGMDDWQALHTICAPPAGSPPPPPSAPPLVQQHIPPSESGRTKVNEKFGRMLLALPFAASAMMMIGWGDPVLIVILVAITSAILVHIDAKRLGMGDYEKVGPKWKTLLNELLGSGSGDIKDLHKKGKKKIGPVAWALLQVPFWIPNYPQYLFERKKYGAKNYGWAGWVGVALVLIAFVISYGAEVQNAGVGATADATAPLPQVQRVQAPVETATSPQQKSAAQTETKAAPSRQQTGNTASLPHNVTERSIPKQQDLTENAKSYDDLTKACSPKVVTMVQTFEEGKYYDFPMMNIADANNKLMLVYYTQTTYSGGIKSEDQKLCGILAFPNESTLSNANLEEDTPVRAVGKFIEFRNVPMDDGTTKRLPVFECPGIEIRGTYFKTK